MRVVRFVLATLISASSFQACSTRTQFTPGEIPPAQAPSQDDINKGGQTVAALSQHFQRTPNKELEQTVVRVLDRIVRSADGSQGRWTLAVLNCPSQNAMATVGNHVVVFDGLFTLVKNEDELAAVLAHEIGHVLAKHSRKDPLEKTASGFVKGVASLADAGLKSPNYSSYNNSNAAAGAAVIGLTSAVVGMIAQKTLVEPEQHRKELEADMIGLFLMANAGYNPSKAIDLWKRVAESSKASSGFSLFSSHPAPEDRLEEIQAMIPDATKLFDQSPHRQIVAGNVAAAQRDAAKQELKNSARKQTARAK